VDLPATLLAGRSLRVVGFDDGPFYHRSTAPVVVAGVVCRDTRFEGLVWGSVSRDGLDATERLCQLLVGGKFLSQLHALLLDGITLGGLNVVDLHALHQRLGLPCIAFLRRPPDLAAFQRALDALPDADLRRALVAGAGPLHQVSRCCFQVQGLEPTLVPPLLQRITDQGLVPEALRLAHLIARAVVTGESGRRA
jgi:endonuclease V-like protein UPF0215 family